jgi:hypothetical protein
MKLRQDLHHVPFFTLVDLDGLPPQGTLEGASGRKSMPGPYATSLIELGETAWRTPFRDLTCSVVSTLLEQKAGLQWLGRPAIQFASRYPTAEIQYYPGEISLSCLRAAAELSRVARPEFETWVRGDFAWIRKAYGWSPRFLSEVEATLEAARLVSRQ